MKIRLQKAYRGDCIWIRYGDKEKTNIIIDSGPAGFSRGFKNIIKNITDEGENIDLLILTHIDDDHIQGFFKYISNNNNNCQCLKEVWLNGYGMNVYQNNQLHSPRNIREVTRLLKYRNIKVVNFVCEGYEVNINGAHLKVITPTKEAIFDVAEIIDQYSLHRAREIMDDIDYIYDNLEYSSDHDKKNKASISVVITYNGKRMAFLGDSHAEDVVNGKNKYFKNIKMDLVKISHHGSKHNTNKELIQCLGSREFIILTNKVVDKENISTIVRNVNKSKIYCNYNWWNSSNYFTDNDRKKYIDTGKLEILEKLEIDLLNVGKRG
ncbi:MBL fold metallo-hydrolase [Clostridium botulinum]|nr:MBL fold metallo-hydrolase [Clostridium botulinum]EKS4395274.1 MBL fold metallo-hydrolase [Clostridium botulinum]